MELGHFGARWSFRALVIGAAMIAGDRYHINDKLLYPLAVFRDAKPAMGFLEHPYAAQKEYRLQHDAVATCFDGQPVTRELTFGTLEHNLTSFETQIKTAPQPARDHYANLLLSTGYRCVDQISTENLAAMTGYFRLHAEKNSGRYVPALASLADIGLSNGMEHQFFDHLSPDHKKALMKSYAADCYQQTKEQAGKTIHSILETWRDLLNESLGD
ncbi:hypothetical protein HZB02_06745 [Candidatus Woesearchaeota archaeon]|nr:hypothetical protein [Candidatus Woesearchaeota archaeon]